MRVPLGAFADLLQRRQELRDVESGESAEREKRVMY